MAQNRQQMGTGKGQTYYNDAVSKDMGGYNGFPAGSTFKMFVAAAALENGFGTGTSFQVPYEKDWGVRPSPTAQDRSSRVGSGR